MSTTATVQALNINGLKRFSGEARVSMPLITSQDLVTRMNCYEPGQVTPFHVHPRDDEMIFCVEGRGTITFADRSPMPIEQGSLIVLPKGLPHGIAAAADGRMVVIYALSADYTSERPRRGRRRRGSRSTASARMTGLDLSLGMPRQSGSKWRYFGHARRVP